MSKRKDSMFIKKAILKLIILIKWFKDRHFIPLSYRDLHLYFKIHIFYHKELGSFPNLISPHDYNEKIQWLKLFDQNYLVARCSDKLSVKNYVQQKLGDGYTPLTLASGDSFSSIPIKSMPKSFVIKTNHDSGSVFLIKDKSNIQISKLNKKISESLAKTYGQENGEWQYQLIPPKVFAESYIGDPSNPYPPADYKFHCSNGKVLWLQYIYDRGSQTKETIIDDNGTPLSVHFDHNMTHSKNFSKPIVWDSMVDIAEKLSKPFKYVRVDLFEVDDKIYVGELTFYPLAGCYKGQGQVVLGERLNFIK